MKALTVCQPYAHAIVHGTPIDGRLVHKRVENRTWGTTHRGVLLIHAGKSRQWLDSWDWPMPEGLVYGALIGVVDLIVCCWLEYLGGKSAEELRQDFGMDVFWVLDHPHTCGPVCWILDRPRAFAEPIPYRGAPGLFEVPDELVAEAIRRAAA